MTLFEGIVSCVTQCSNGTLHHILPYTDDIHVIALLLASSKLIISHKPEANIEPQIVINQV